MRGLIAYRLPQLATPAAGAGWFQFYHVSAVAREMHAAIRPRHSLTEVEYFHALEGQVIMRHL
jgi:hypothetical protein